MSSEQRKESRDLVSTIVGLFTSARLTVVLIGIIAVLAFLGVTGRFGFRDVYHARYFQVILGLLFTNLLACTIDRLPGAIRRMRMDMGPVAPPPPKKADYLLHVNASDPEDVLTRAEQVAFGKSRTLPRRELEKPPALVSFSSSGRLSLLGPHVTHLGIMAILLGGIIGSISPFRGYVYLKPGEEAHKVLTMSGQGTAKLGFTLRCNDFKVTFYKDTGAPSDYLCDLSVIEGDKEVARKVVEVNQPLYYQGYGFYQSSYGPMIRLTAKSVADGSTMVEDVRLWEQWTLPGTNISYTVAEHEPHSFGMGRDLGPSITVQRFEAGRHAETIKLFEKFPEFDAARQDRFRLSFRTLPDRHWTGLQVVRDPGLPLIWTGSGLLVLGVMLSFFIFHRRLWLVVKEEGSGVELALMGRTRKAQGMFEKRLAEISDKLKKELGVEKGGPSQFKN